MDVLSMSPIIMQMQIKLYYFKRPCDEQIYSIKEVMHFLLWLVEPNKYNFGDDNMEIFVLIKRLINMKHKNKKLHSFYWMILNTCTYMTIPYSIFNLHKDKVLYV